MYPRYRNLVWLFVLGSAAIGTWYLSREPVADREVTQTPGAASLGYYLNDAVVIGTDAQGEVLYRIIAGHVEENPDTKQLILEDIEVEYRDEAGVPWRISAASASGPMDRAYLDMHGNVSIEHLDTDTHESAIIEAADVRLVPESYFASTEGPVNVRIGDTRIAAVGLSLHLKDDKIDLESDVHAQIRK